MPSGTLMRKIVRHPSPAISTPPSEGPSVVPIADIVPSSPIALPVFSFGTVSPTMATVSAIMIAAPSPCAARAAMRNQSVGAAPHSSDATVKIPMPPRSSRRRPTMSPRRPTLTIRVVMASRYARTIHWTAWNDAPNAWASAGRPALAMLVSSDGISMERERAASAQRCVVNGFKRDSLLMKLCSAEA